MIEQAHTHRRMTLQRRIILDFVRDLKVHPTADEVYRAVREKLPKVSLGTVYRNLDVLSNDGQIRRVDVPGGQCRYDGCLDDHYHIRCVSCGRIDDMMRVAVSIRGNPSGVPKGYRLIGHRVEFTGVCGDCGGVEPARM